MYKLYLSYVKTNMVTLFVSFCNCLDFLEKVSGILGTRIPLFCNSAFQQVSRKRVKERSEEIHALTITAVKVKQSTGKEGFPGFLVCS